MGSVISTERLLALYGLLQLVHRGDIIEGGALELPAAVLSGTTAGARLLGAEAGHPEQQLLCIAHQIRVAHSCGKSTASTEDVATGEGYWPIQ